MLWRKVFTMGRLQREDEENIRRAMRGELPPCKEDSVNYPMHEFFCNLKDDSLNITFDELGSKRGDWGDNPKKLPPSAYLYDTWWQYDFKNEKHRHALAWLTAGWYIEGLHRSHELLIFERFPLPKFKK